MDFTLSTYKSLLKTLIQANYFFLTFQEYIEKQYLSSNYPMISSLVILRHDIDRIPANALTLARLEHSLGIKGTYYFRIVSESYNELIMSKVAELGHEIGYHYEDVDIVYQKLKIEGAKLVEYELADVAYENFCKNLNFFRNKFEIKTICMHGSPMSKCDNKIIWEKYDYKKLGLIGEPYFDVDFNEVLYLTDTGRAWNISGGNVRDKVKSKYNYNFKSTFDIIRGLGKNELPDRIMLNAHPQRWTDNWFLWANELVIQNLKNVIKRIFFVSKR